MSYLNNKKQIEFINDGILIIEIIINKKQMIISK